jgi:hypothetical protein
LSVLLAKNRGPEPFSWPTATDWEELTFDLADKFVELIENGACSGWHIEDNLILAKLSTSANQPLDTK